jgi:hypothetical protein
MPPAIESDSSCTAPPSHPTTRSVSPVARARSLRVQARRLDPVVAVAYRRRAAELSFEAWLQATREAAVEVDRFAAVAT